MAKEIKMNAFGPCDQFLLWLNLIGVRLDKKKLM